jgi:DNA-binding CsgD family transcriptional regulator
MGHQIDTHPAGDAGSCGDFAEHVYLDPSRSAMIVGDVAGRSAAVGNAADALRAYVRSALLSGVPLQDCLSAIDGFFSRSIMSDAVPFASLFIAVADVREDKLRYGSAGHEPGLLFDDRGGHRHLEPTGPVLGLRALLARPAFGERAVPLAGGELLVIVTDGITGARRSEGDAPLTFFGSTGVVRAVHEARANLHDTAGAIHAAAVARRSAGGWETLTRAEQRVAYLIANGYTNRSVASELVVSQSTVATHARSIYGKLGVASRVQLTLAVMNEKNPAFAGFSAGIAR